MSRENTHIYINNTAHNIADYTQIQIIYKRWLVKYLHAFNCRIDWFVCYFFFILDETEGKVISINLEEIYINRFQEIERFNLTEVETFDISNSSSFLRFNFGIAKCEGKVSIPKWHQMAMTVCKYELHFGVDISIFRVCPVEVTTGLCDITVSFLKAPNGIFTIKKL